MIGDCVDCHVPLVPTSHEGRALGTCGSCGGAFIAHAALVDVAKDADTPRSSEERRAAVAHATGRHDELGGDPRRCPTCARPMRRHVYAFSSGVVVDSCDAHGIWLDAGELARIEAWSEATAHGTREVIDARGAQSAEVPDPQRRGIDRAELDVHARTLAAFGHLEARAALTAHDAAQALLAPRRSRADARDAMSTARIGAEIDRIPTAAEGAISCEASVRVPSSADATWPAIFRVEELTRWMSGLEAAHVVSGAGSSRVQELRYVGDHVVHQRVTELHAGRSVTWRDEREWLRGLEVPTWHGGCWSRLQVAPDQAGTLVTWTITYRAHETAGRARIDERLAALGGWMRASLERLAAGSGE